MNRLLSLVTIISFVVVSTTAFAPNSRHHVSVHTVSRSIASTTTTSSSSSSSSLVTLQAMLQQAELPEKLYIPKEKEVPKVLGGLKIGLRKLVVITGASSGLGLNTAITLAKSGRYFIVMACRDVEKGKRGTLYMFENDSSF